jgi:peroxin-5
LEDVQRLLLCALEQDHSDSDAVSDVWEALGVVYNVSRDYPAAVEAFTNAIRLRPGDYQLYNKLGATLANSQQSDRALPIYQQALQIKPKYARAWLNLAIAHSNLQNYNEAARCYLQTLSLNPAAVHCWSYLRIALSCCERWDLIPLVSAQDLSAFSEHFDFVRYS